MSESTIQKKDTEEIFEPTEEELKNNQRFYELQNKGDELTEEEREEKQKLKDKYYGRVKDRINRLTKEAAEAQERYGSASQKVQDYKRRIQELEDKVNQVQSRPSLGSQETVTFGGKQYFTDAALQSMIQSGQMTEVEANKHWQQRYKAEIKDELFQEQQQTRKQQEESSVRQQDAAKVLEQYPYFAKDHSNYNPNDPLFKEAQRIYANGYQSNPRGLSLAVEEAKKILGIDKKKPDLSGEFNMETSDSSGERSTKKQEVVLSEYEQEAAIRSYCRGDVINPKTQRPYTEKEAIEKAKQAKANRKSRRVA